MKFQVSAWLLPLLATSMLVGCTGGDSGASGAAGGGGGGNNLPANQGAANFSIDLGQFGGANRDDVVIVNTEAGQPQVTVRLNPVNREVVNAKASPQDALKDWHSSRDLPPDILEAERQQVERAIAARGIDSVRPRGEILPKFQELAVGSDTTFFISTTGQNVTARKMLDETQTVHSVIFAEVRNGAPVVTPAVALEIATAFDTNNPFRQGSGIYDQVRALYGSEWNVNPPGGRDGDQKIAIVLLSSQTIGSAGLFGFFRPSDEFSKAQVATSNEGEILYINIDVPQYDYLATLAHEFQHMIRYNTKFIRQGLFDGVQENGTLDEGASVLAEELTGYSLTSPGGGNSFMFGAVRRYLERAGLVNLFSFNGNFEFYGGGYLLMKYFREHFGDAALLTASTNTAVGFGNLATVSGLTEHELFRRFSVTLLTSGFTGNIEPIYRYPSGFSTIGTFEVRGQGTQTLPGLQPDTVVNPPTSSADIIVLQFSPTLVRVEGGTGAAVTLRGLVTGLVSLNNVVQPTPGVVSAILVVLAGPTGVAREAGGLVDDQPQARWDLFPSTAPAGTPLLSE